MMHQGRHGVYQSRRTPWSERASDQTLEETYPGAVGWCAGSSKAICSTREWKSQPIINITRLLSSEPCSITFAKSTRSREADEVIQSINALPILRPTVFDSDLSI